MDLVYTYIDKYSMDVVGMFPLKKNTPPVSYREGGGGGGGGRYIKNWSIPSNTSVHYTERKPKNKKRGRPENKAIENQQEDSVNILTKIATCKRSSRITTHYVCERNSEKPSWKLSGYAPGVVLGTNNVR